MNHYISKEKYRLVDYQYLQTGNTYESIKIIVFELIDKEDNDKGQKLLKHVIDENFIVPFILIIYNKKGN